MSLLSDRAQCWLSYIRDGKKSRLEGMVITRIVYDDVSETKNLLIYCLYGYEKVRMTAWKEGLKSLVKYAVSRDCEKIIGYTDVPFIIKTVERLGGETNYTFVSLPVR